MPRGGSSRRWMVAALVALSGLVLLLTKRVADLSAGLDEVRRLATLPHAGTVVPTFRAVTLAGDSVTVGATADSTWRQVLFVLTTTCPHCLRTLPAWEALAEALRQSGRPVEVLGISLDSADSTRHYVTAHGLGFPVLLFPEAKLARLYRAAVVPQTIVLDHSGTVLYAKIGVLDRAAYSDSVFQAVAGWPAAADPGQGVATRPSAR